MPQASRKETGKWVRVVVGFGAVCFLGVSVAGLTDPALHQSALAVEFLVLVAATIFARKFGIALPGKGFASFTLGVVLFAMLHQGWQIALWVAAMGVTVGDIVLRRLRVPDALANGSHAGFATGIAGTLYALTGGWTGSDALTEENFVPLSLAVLLLPAIANLTYYLETSAHGVSRIV